MNVISIVFSYLCFEFRKNKILRTHRYYVSRFDHRSSHFLSLFTSNGTVATVKQLKEKRKKRRKKSCETKTQYIDNNERRVLFYCFFPLRTIEKSKMYA